MTSIAAVILAHRDAPHVQRLIHALDDVPVLLHCDSKAPAEVAAEMLRGAGDRVQALPRTSGALNSWSLVRIELDALRAALRRSSASHIAVLSGADYPLVAMPELHNRLQPWSGRSYLVSAAIPFPPWSVPRHQDGGQWRARHHFFTRGDDLLTVRGIPVRLPWRRRLPDGLVMRASSQWKVYWREDVVRLLAAVDARPDLIKFWRSTLVPDESFVASMLASPSISGGSAVPECYGSPWFLRWAERGSHHPAWLGAADFEAIAAAQRAPARSPGELEQPPTEPGQAWFARKMSSEASTDLLDQIDAELRRA